MRQPRWRDRLGIAMMGAAGALGGAVASALVLAVLDLYLTGHGRPSLLRPWIDWTGLGVHLSRGDLLMLAVAALSALWFGRAARARSRRVPQSHPD